MRINLKACPATQPAQYHIDSAGCADRGDAGLRSALHSLMWGLTQLVAAVQGGGTQGRFRSKHGGKPTSRRFGRFGRYKPK